MENSKCFHELNYTLRSLAAATASSASITSVLFGETLTCTCDKGFALNQSNPILKDFDVYCVIDGPRSSFVVVSVCQPVSCGKILVVQNSKTISTKELFYSELKSNRTVLIECVAGYTTNGSASGPVSFEFLCLESGLSCGLQCSTTDVAQHC